MKVRIFNFICILFLFSTLLIINSCGKVEIQAWCLRNCISTDPSPLILSNFQTSAVTYNGFQASFDFTGDDNQNSDVKIYYCSIKNASGCDVGLTPWSV